MDDKEALPPVVEPEAYHVSPWQARIRTVRAAFQGLGAIVCVLFAAQGGASFANYEHVQDFWQGCRWFAEGCLYITVGVCGCIWEMRVCFPRVRLHLHTFVVNRLVAAAIYIWIGCFSMGGRIALNDTWEVLGRTTGILAWVVGIGDIAMSCCSDRTERLYAEEQRELEFSTAVTGDDALANSAASVAPPRWPAVAPRPAAATTYGNSSDGTVKASAPTEPPSGTDAENPFGATAADAPEGGWATVGGKPFGAS